MEPMKYSKLKKAVAAGALVMTGFGIFDAAAGALCKPTPQTHTVDASPYDVLCRIGCKKH